MTHEIPQPIAIIGSACRLPGNASSSSKLWELLRNPVDLCKETPRDRFSWEGVYRPDGLHNSTKTKSGYWLEENIRHFDPQFFNIPPAEAESLDPQHRLLLENVYEAMESAGLTLEGLQGGDTGVFVGLMGNEYFDNARYDLEAASGQMLTTGTSRGMASNRVSYIFDLRGPSLTIDTACSSSMMAVHLAVASLRRNECKIAFACGTNLNLAPHDFISMTKMNMISGDGRSKMFNDTANGYGRGEGVAVVCLKRLDAAIEDGDYIECVIRETGTNQDGRTRGITMPSPQAQADLIRQTYRKAGLDPTQLGSRPSFFEAHGTGTTVGDPVEAEAIAAAFFPPGQEYTDNEILYVGSIKTVVGHTEGTAGIAGLLKAALAVRYGVIPPNLLFSRMNPAVAPFTKHMRLVTAANPWPDLPTGCPRRASINSFGYGGSNVHVIIESYPDAARRCIVSLSSLVAGALPIFTPFTFSGISENALLCTLVTFLDYLNNHKTSVSLRDLAWTLQYRRSQFSFRCAIAVATVEELRKKLESAIQIAGSKGATAIATRPSPIVVPRIMGIFTGQGAQWASMGRELIERSAYAREIIEKLDSSLSSLPVPDRPTWRLVEELMIDGTQSRINEASLSQPSTTAVQILLVDLLRVAGVKLHAVVGHSSGEIGAAYAAGLISAEQAIKIAYYRGRHAELAAGQNKQPGGMLATYLTAQQALQLCHSPIFRGRITVAAFNSPSIVTLSGDADAIHEAATDLEKRNIFARRLKVDKAYHSHHMDPCSSPYLKSLEQCNISASVPLDDGPIWFSSVHCRRIIGGSRLRGPYWVDNLKSPVRFSEAVMTAISEVGVPDLFLEIGPHPALKEPLRQIVGESVKTENAYTSLMKRDNDSKTSFAEALGLIWTQFGRSTVDFANYDRVLSGGLKPTLLKDLPSYPWHHDREYWWENRYLRRRFQETHPPNQLLGHSLSTGAQHEAKWRHFLKPKETPWLMDHKVNGLAILPGAAYVAMATSAAERLFPDSPLEVIDIEDLRFLLPLSFVDEHTSIEVILTVTNIVKDQKRAKADFFVDFCSHQRRNELMSAASGKLVLRFGADMDRANPESVTQHSVLIDVSPDRFYKSLEDEGFTFTGPFRSITSLRRRMDFAEGEIRLLPTEMTFHPAVLDGLFQASFAAYGFPGDSSMPNLRVPSRVKSIKVFPMRCQEAFQTCQPVLFQVMKTGPHEYGGILYPSGTEGASIYVEGLSTASFHFSTPNDDVKMFSEVVWRSCEPNAQLIASTFVATPDKTRLARLCERVALFYLRKLNGVIPYDEEIRLEGPLRHLLAYARLVLAGVLLDLQPNMERDWLQDTDEDMLGIVQSNPGCIEITLMDAIGKAYPSIFSGQQTPLDVLTKNDMLSRFYREGLGNVEANAIMAQYVETVSNQSPHIRILEIGAGTGAATRPIVEQASFRSYTFTDISPAFLAPAQEIFRSHAHKMRFKTLNIEKDVIQQGYETASFEVIVASNVIHACVDVKAVLGRIRSLLRPGGYFVCVELAENQTRNTVVMGGLPGWWVGHGEDRSWSPALKEEQWNDYLKESGFSGVDAITQRFDELVCPYRVFASRAIDDRVTVLQKPLSFGFPKSSDDIMILGEDPPGSEGLANAIANLLSASFKTVLRVANLQDLNGQGPVPYVVLCLLELKKPVFMDMTPHGFAMLKKLLREATDIMWITKACRVPTSIEAIFGNMMVGLGRSLRHEQRHLRLMFSDIDCLDSLSARKVSEDVLRWYILGQWAAEGWDDKVLFGHHIELASENGIRLFPNVVHSRSRNDRYNAQHRRITHEVRAYAAPTEVHFNGTSGLYNVRENPRSQAGNGDVCIKMLYSTLYALKISTIGSLFVGLGLVGGARPVIVFTDTLRSWVQVPQSTVNACNPPKGYEKQYLRTIVCDLIAERILCASRTAGHLLVVSADPLCMSIIERKASKSGKKVVFVTSDPYLERYNATFLHPNSLDFKIRQSIPEGASLIVNLSNQPNDEILFRRLSLIYKSRFTRLKNWGDMFRTQSSGNDPVPAPGSTFQGPRNPVQALADLPTNIFETATVHCLSPKDVSQQPLQQTSAILDWTIAECVHASIQPATAVVKFKSDKSYLIIGTSDIARSICEWMIVNGARYITMASRNPEPLTDWVKDMSSRGASVDLRVLDITDSTSTKEMLSSTEPEAVPDTVRPPLAGVIHLALVLRDGSFSKMTFEDMKIVTDVKAKGSLNLHEHLLNEKLDFFVMTSSISYALGAPGQANYACGNAFMAGLANYRRAIGLAASVVHLGRVTGIGYITRSEREKVYDLDSEDVRKLGLYPISERDLHQIFAEAVLASPPDSGLSAEIIAGIRSVEPDMLPHCPWASEPMFVHLLKLESTETTAKRKPERSVREKLRDELSSVSMKENSVYETIRAALLDRLSVMLQIEQGVIDDQVSLLDLGIDSLVATEIGSWSRKELRVQVPHSMVFGGASVADIVHFTVKHLDRAWVMLKN
ncbi:hypothetical protein BCR34DRAFT_506815 [Clohesyomyces aquaticus]|uniref:Uncharacterized protein n=1 Tax=Clohesyomyces aquaticus TaxID=1231657 RepID=A0A1Y2A2Q7_9PLEO|nr:hypothetical protein BCR34DRAFT_506815 [Clohesyomyces aquaticus]